MKAIIIAAAVMVWMQPGEEAPVAVATGVSVSGIAVQGETVILQQAGSLAAGRTLYAFDVAKGTKVWTSELPRSGAIVGVGEDGALIMVSSSGTKGEKVGFDFIDLDSKMITRRVAHDKVEIGRVTRVSQSRAWACSVANSKLSLTMMSLKENNKYVPMVGHLDPICDVAISSDDKLVAAVGGQEVKIWDIGSGQAAAVASGLKGEAAASVFFGRNSKLLVVGSKGQASIIEVARRASVGGIDLGKARPYGGCCGFLRDDAVFYYAHNNSIRFFETKGWRPLSDRAIACKAPENANIDRIVISSDEKYAVVTLSNQPGAHICRLPKF